MAIAYAAKPVYQTSRQKIDENLKLKEITLVFDISEIQAQYPDFDNLGIGCNASQNDDPTKEKALKLYKGTRDDGELLDTQYENRLQTGELFRAGNEITFYYNDIQLEEGSTYTLYAYYTFFVNPAGKTNGAMKSSTKLVYTYDAPIIIQFEAASQQAPTLKFIESSPSENSLIGTLDKVSLKFDSEIKIANVSDLKVTEFGVAIASPSLVEIDSENPKQLLISFDNVSLYKTHSYELEIPEKCLAAANNDQVLNETIRIPLNGDSWKYLKNGRVYPPSNTEILESPLIQIPMIFPDGYGFVSLTGGPEVFKGYWYEGENSEVRNEVEVQINNSANGVEVNPQFPLVPGKTYTFVFPEGQIVPRSLSNRIKLGDTSNATYTLTYYTPAAENIGSVEFEGLDQSEASTNRIDKLSFKIKPYKYNDVEYNVLNMGAKAILYVDDEETASAEYPLDIVLNGTEKTLETKESINLVMMQGSTYRFVIPENKIVPMHELFRSLGGNKETSFVYTGTTPTTVNVTYSIVNAGSIKKAEAINKPIAVEFVPETGWVVKEVLLNNEAVELEGNSYTIPALTEDATISIEYAYEKEIPFLDLTTGVGEIAIEGTDYVVFNEDGAVVIDNLKGGENITVYNLAGLRMAEHQVSSNNNRVQIPLSPGCYVITIDNTAFKIQH